MSGSRRKGSGSRHKGSNSRRRKSSSSARMSDDELRRYAKLLIIPIVLIVLIIVVFVSNSITELKGQKTEPASVDSASKDVDNPGTSIAPDNKEYTHDFGESPLKKDEIPEVTQLMEAYFEAEASCDVDKFNSLFTSGDTSQSEALKAAFEKQKEYIEGYQNISCYTVSGPYDNYYIAYTYYETKYLLAETPGPGLIHPYVVRGDDGTWKIYDGEMTDELNRYLEEVEALEDVRLLAAEVDNDLDQAMEEDDELRKIIDFVRGGFHNREESSYGETDGSGNDKTDESGNDKTDEGGNDKTDGAGDDGTSESQAADRDGD